MAFCLPLLFEVTTILIKLLQALTTFTQILVVESVPTSSALSDMLQSVREHFPQQFHRPLFLCAAAAKDSTIIAQLKVLGQLVEHLPDFWFSNAEMVAVAMMSGATSSRGKAIVAKESAWGSAKLGQCVIIAELLSSVRKLNTDRVAATVSETSYALLGKLIILCGVSVV